jgi:glucuronate isomerase
MSFLGETYLLQSEPAKDLYDRVKDLPIVDPHNHADIAEIVANQAWTDIWVVEGATDHYVWELMRRRGIPEEKITGTATNQIKWEALAKVFPSLVGNPTYEWIHLDLYRQFKIEKIISPETATEIWSETRVALSQPGYRPQALMQTMNIEIMATTDDPTMDLKFHERARDAIQSTRILPTWRPDKAMNVEKAPWRRFVEQLGEETEDDTSSLKGFLSALRMTHDYFARLGCVASDHGLFQPYSHFVPQKQAESIHQKALRQETLTADEVNDYKAFMLNTFARMNAEAGWVTQLHIGPVRDYRDSLWEQLGPDSGGDISAQDISITENLRPLLNEFDEKLQIVLYCVDPTHFPTLATIARAFPNVSLGAAWWWNDSPYGMETQLKYLATVDLLSNFAGMVTDSRKLISFGSRTEMFRRVLCNVMGEMILKGQAPEEAASTLVESLAYERPYQLFFE